MDYKDSLENEIKKIYEADVKDIELSSKAIESIIQSRKTGLREKISNLLNKEIEVLLAPAIIGFILILVISIFPKGFVTTEKAEKINFNGSQIIMTSKREVSME